ncbi:MAG: branched-chain-amino-acid transaminase [Spirochaetes bacterium GWF1_51_8]|nr:MAG: branched-chain-amino-acid transaminase [Spirochaetes bacterium GWF1_51_8]
MGKKVWLNGGLVDRENAAISVFDHGVLYGDGVFEGIRFYERKVFKLDEHIDRLFNSAKIIMLDIPVSKEELKQAILLTCRESGLDNGYVRPVVTRGTGPLGLAPWKCSNPSVFIIADTIQLYPAEHYRNGMPIVTVPTRRNISEAVNPMIKSLNYLNNILAKIEAKTAGVEEALMLNQEGYVAECTGDNIFIIRKGVIYTPPVYAGALPGITMSTVAELAAGMGVNLIDKLFTRAEIYTADECFLTGTAAEVVPVISLDGRVIGDGKPGAITRKLVERFQEYARANGTPIG